MIFSIGDSRGEKIKLSDGLEITSEELVSWVNGLHNSKVIILLEGPQSGWISNLVNTFKEGTTLVSSCDREENENTFSPWNRSFSASFFSKCLQGKSVIESFNASEILFLNPFLGQIQKPQIIAGDLADIQLSGRFFPAQLPDLNPPEFLKVDYSFPSENILRVEVITADNQDTPGNLSAKATAFSLEGVELQSFELIPSGTDETYTHFIEVSNLFGPIFFLKLESIDLNQNTSKPLLLFVSTFENNLIFDFNGDNVISKEDLLELIDLKNKGLVTRNTLFLFQENWMAVE